MDISELHFKINKNQAVNDLKSVEGQLEKTGDAANGLIDILKDIGLTLGIGKVIKESIQLNNQFKSLEAKFDAIFSGGFDTRIFSDLRSELSLSDNALKNILSTTGQFARGLGQSSQYVKSFSTDLTKAAADYAAYQGKTSAQDVNEYARKFAKASLGEVGELKEMGIIVDNTSVSFKNAVKNIQETLGVSEAQAKQMETTKRLLEQVQIASGSASTNMNDGWVQLNLLFENFKEILGDVGEIFSAVFGPILNVFNSILEIPLVKSTTAWVIAIGGVIAGFVTLTSLLKKIGSALDNLGGGSKTNPILEFSKKWEKSVQEVREEYEHIFRIASSIGGVTKHAPSFAELSPAGKKLFEGNLKYLQDHRRSRLYDEYKNAQTPFKILRKEVQASGLVFEDLLETIPGVNSSFIEMAKVWLGNKHHFGKAFQSMFSVIKGGYGSPSINPSYVESFQHIFRHMRADFRTLFKGVLGKSMKDRLSFPGLSNDLWLSFVPLKVALKELKILFRLIRPSLTGFVSVLKVLAIPLATISGLIGIFSIGIDATTRAIQKNESVYEAFANSKVANSILNVFRSIFDGIMEIITLGFWDSKKNQDTMRKFGDDVSRTFISIGKDGESFKKELQDLQFEKVLATLLPEDELKALQLKQKESAASVTNLAAAMKKAEAELQSFQKLTNKMAADRNYDSYTDEDRQTALTNLKDAQEKLKTARNAYINELKNQESIQNKVAAAQKKINDLQWKYFNEVDKLVNDFNRINESFAMGYKKGKFTDLAGEAKYKNDLMRIEELSNHLSAFSLANANENIINQSKAFLTEIFNLTKAKYKYEISQLLSQRDVMINNLKAMNNIVAESAKLRVTTQTAVEATSAEAVNLQARRMESMSKNELSPMVEQQKEVKEIEKRVLEKQSKATDALRNINEAIYKVMQKMGSGVYEPDFSPVNPL